MIDRRKIINIWEKTVRQIKNFLESTKSREFLIFLFFFIVAGAFWLLQTLNDDYETEFSVPVRLRNVPNNIVVTSEPASDIRVRVKDKGTVLINYLVSKNFFPVNIDFNDYPNANNRIRVLASDYERKIATQLNASTRLLSVIPDTLEYIFAEGEFKSVPVKFQGKAVAGREYYITDTIFSPDSVLVYAPKPILDTIKNAYIDKVAFENILDTLKHQAPLINIRGAKFVPASTLLTLPVDIYTEKTVEVPVYGVNFPSDKILRTFPSKVQVTFQLGMGKYKEITGDFFPVNIPYQDLVNSDSDKYTIKLNNIPEGTSIVRINPEQIDFLIEHVAND